MTPRDSPIAAIAASSAVTNSPRNPSKPYPCKSAATPRRNGGFARSARSRSNSAFSAAGDQLKGLASASARTASIVVPCKSLAIVRTDSRAFATSCSDQSTHFTFPPQMSTGSGPPAIREAKQS